MNVGEQVAERLIPIFILVYFSAKFWERAQDAVGGILEAGGGSSVCIPQKCLPRAATPITRGQH